MNPCDYDLIGVGSPILDILAPVPEAFLQKVGGEKGGMVLVEDAAIARWLKELGGAYNQAPGGSSGNTTFAAARLGLRTTFLGKTGNDRGGAYYREAFARAGGDPGRFKVGELPNGRCLALITPDSQRTLRTYLGAAATLSPDEISPADFAGCRHAHIEGYLLFNPALIRKVLSCAKTAGCSISLDLASFEVVHAAKPELEELLNNYVDMVFANDEEAAAFCGAGKSPAVMAAELARRVGLAVVKAGAQGAWLAQAGEVIHTPALTGIQAIDTTGAGDYWAAGFLSGHLGGLTLAAAAARGARMGAEIVQVIGAELPPERWQTVLRDFAINA